jgi:hypothetical protein
MIKPLPFGRKQKSWLRVTAEKHWGLIVLLVLAIDRSNATGFYGPSVYLDQGGKIVNASPEFYWELEVKRLAKDFTPEEKRAATPPIRKPGETDEGQDEARSQITLDADARDFAAALQEGRIKPDDPAKAAEQNAAARKLIAGTNEKTTEALPEEFDSEFRDYHRGAFAYRLRRLDEAQAAWETLLKRPAEERHYRTVWAAFMLGKLALKKGSPDATRWFQQVRDLAKEGFADSLGMAADSYGWEGRSEWKQNHPEKAARLFLTQLALGDESAIVSLKALIPDREPIEGMLNYGPEGQEREGWSDEQRKAEEERTLVGLETAAKDPLLRRLVTAHILATETSVEYKTEPPPRVDRCARWLSIINEAHLDQVEDAEYLGWVAYTIGKYPDAEHWLELAKRDAPAKLWLQAKLQRRAGKLEEAARSMVQAWQLVVPVTSYTSWTGISDPRYDEPSDGGESSWSLDQSASGDLGAMYLERADFVTAMDVLRKGNLWDDMAFVAEVPYNRVLEHYVKALKDGADEKLPKLERARAWFTAAWLARYDGMELMGTEGSPDGFSLGGEFEFPDLARRRRSGVYQTTRYEDGKEKVVTAPIAVKTTKPELQRLAKNNISPDLRFHYRVVAGALAMQAAGLLQANSEELADVINTAGLWVKDRDQKTGDRYYQVLEKRCAQTNIGRAALAKHWFVDQTGPWSQEQQAAYKKLHQELGLGPS